MTLEQLKSALADRNVQAVAKATGINPHTLYRIQQGKTKPHQSTMRLLAQYLGAPENVQP
jgi:transcriptional regulator with XRE-family HTH domain